MATKTATPTTDAIITALKKTNTYLTVAELVAETGKSESTIRENLKKLAAEGAVQADVIDGVKHYTDTPSVPAPQVDDKPRKKYTRHIGERRTETTRVNQITRHEVGVRKTEHEPHDGVDTKWYTICLEHNTVHGEDKLLDAHWYSTYPIFCRPCRPVVLPKVGRRRADVTKRPESAATWITD